MGRIKKTVAVVLVIIILLALASIGYMCMRIFFKKRKKDETEIEEEEEIDLDLLALQKTVVEKTPLAVEGEENFIEEDDETLMVCKRGRFGLAYLMHVTFKCQLMVTFVDHAMSVFFTTLRKFTCELQKSSMALLEIPLMRIYYDTQNRTQYYTFLKENYCSS